MPSPPPRASSLLSLTAGTAGLLVGVQVASKASRDALFLGAFDATWLPWAMLGSGAVSVAAVVLFSRFSHRGGPAKLLPRACLSSALLFFVEATLLGQHRPLTAWLIYAHVAAFGGVMMSSLWSLFSELFNPSDARRFVGRVGAGGTLGGVLGGLLVERASAAYSIGFSLPLLGALHLLAWALTRRLGRAAPSAEGAAAADDAPGADDAADATSDDSSSTLGALGMIGRDPHLRGIALFVALLAMTAALTDFAFKATASERGGDRELMSFFAFYYAGVSLLTFLLQSLLSERSLSRWGLAGTLAQLPVTLLALALLATGVPSLWTTTALRGSGAVLENSMHRSSYELLYTPLGRRKRRATKPLLDVGVSRLGDAAGAVLVLACVAWLPQLAPRAATALAALSAGLALALVWHLRAGYVSALAESLRSGVLEAESLQVRDATTRQTIADTTMALDRERLLREIERFRRQGAAGTEQGGARDSEAPAERERLLSGDATQDRRAELEDWLRLLWGSDPRKVQERAELTPFPVELAPLLVPRLAETSWAETARSVLGALSPRITGLLGDVLLDETRDPTLRRRIPQLLSIRPQPRGVECLLRGLRAERFDVRYRAAQALVAIQETAPELVRPDTTEIHELVVNELARSQEPGGRLESIPPLAVASSSARAPHAEEGHEGATGVPAAHAGPETQWLQDLMTRRLQRQVEQAFLLLSLVHERQTLARCLTALSGEDLQARGTALEYLENVLPAAVRLALEPHLAAAG